LEPLALLRSAAIRHRLESEAGGLPWVAFTANHYGKLAMLSDTPNPMLAADCELYARDMALGLNRMLHHNGYWILQWCHPEPIPVVSFQGRTYRKVNTIFVDGDGDPQFTIECEDPIHAILSRGVDHWAEQAEQAWTKWHHLMREVLAPKPEQLYLRAAGQAAPSTRH